VSGKAHTVYNIYSLEFYVITTKVIEIESANENDPVAFWNMIKNLGPSKSKQIPMSVYDEDCNLTDNVNYVKQKWKKDLEELFQGDSGQSFNETFYETASREKSFLENQFDHDNANDGLNHNITLEETILAAKKLKNRKSVGSDGIPNEVLKQNSIAICLRNLFDFLFQTSLIPSLWRQSIIAPIPKGATKDPHVPLHYRGISLLSCVYKLYTGILNNRIVDYCESNQIVVEEQNGFRKDRNCMDHIFTLSSLINNKKEVFTAFVDLKKAFDCVNHELILYKLLRLGMTGKIYFSIKSMYSQAVAKVKLEDKFTEWFSTAQGVRQGDTLSPTLFSLYINDLVHELKELNKGISIDETNITCLLYADDLVMVAETPEDLQCQLNVLNNWYQKWRMLVNIEKSKVVHFRNRQKSRTNFVFMYGNEELEIVEQYKYLGLIFYQFLTYNASVEAMSAAGGRALSQIITKFKILKNVGFRTFTSLFDSGVVPILDYGSEVLPLRIFPQYDSVQNRALRYTRKLQSQLFMVIQVG